MNNRLGIARCGFVALFVVLVLLFMIQSASAEVLYVCTNGDPLNGRAEPSKNARVEARFDDGETVEALGYHNGWVQVIGGESGTVWCSLEYLSATLETARYRNTSGGRVFIRDDIEGRKTGLTVDANKVVTVRRQLNGWGYIGTGWVNLHFFEEES